MLVLAIVPPITLSGIPDMEADAAAAKRTLAVRLVQHGALSLCGGALSLPCWRPGAR